MSFDINVFAVRVPKTLRTRWQNALAAQGMACEFRPDFDPDTWTGGDLVAKCRINPKAFDGAEHYGGQDFVTSSGLDILHPPEFAAERDAILEESPRPVRLRLAKATRLYFFNISYERSPEEYRFLIFAAATLTVLTCGVLHDPQDGELLPANVVLKAAAKTTDWFEKLHATRRRAGKGWSLRKFSNWTSALKDAVPEYTPEPSVAAERGGTRPNRSSKSPRRRGG